MARHNSPEDEAKEENDETSDGELDPVEQKEREEEGEVQPTDDETDNEGEPQDGEPSEE